MAFNLLNTFGAGLENRNADTRAFTDQFTSGLQIQQHIGKVEEGLKADLQKIFDVTGTDIPDAVMHEAHLSAESAAGISANVKAYYGHLQTVAQARYDVAQSEMNHQLKGIELGMKMETDAHSRAQVMMKHGNNYHNIQMKTMGQALGTGGRGAQRHRQLMAGSIM